MSYSEHIFNFALVRLHDLGTTSTTLFRRVVLVLLVRNKVCYAGCTFTTKTLTQ